MAAYISRKIAQNIAIVLVFSAVALGSPHFSTADSGLPVPRFVSLKDDRVFARAGPGEKHPIKWEYVRKGFPVEVVDEFGHWRRVRDVDNLKSWVHSVMLSGKRFAIVLAQSSTNGHLNLHRKPEPSSTAIAKVEPGAYGKLLDCTNAWCHIQFETYRGWIRRNQIWGIYPGESLSR
ncbi:MAG: SH3 domain-containing protein [Pseudomonadota bacterium]|nr:SH3 domain-containing protein [Pseudomonadota bacterium]